MDPSEDIVVVERLRKTFRSGKRQTITALDDLDLRVPRGQLVALLGPNGAGKTTTINILTTLTTPDDGIARVAGYDVTTAPAEVRALISTTGQFTAVDEALTARENLVLFGRLLRLDKATATKRADELLDRLGLAESASRRVKGFSGGMRRRLDLAASLIVEPVVLFLDEPTTGLDPHGRTEIWNEVRELRRRGVTILLTTQYLEEADQLADRVIVIDHGRAIAEGTPDELKQVVGGPSWEIDLLEPFRADAVAASLDPRLAPTVKDGTITVPMRNGAQELTAALRTLDQHNVVTSDVRLHRPTLDDVFLALTRQRPASSGDCVVGETAGSQQ